MENQQVSASNGILKRPFPFFGANLPCKTPRANAVYITRELVSTYLITHPHLDHLSGFVINTAAFTQTKCPKRLASLPSTIEAIKKHIFNDIIWPNLSDEESGVGLVTYQRLPIATSDYVEICKGLSVQAWPISHGHCMNTHSHRGSTSEGAERSPGGTIKRMCVYDSAVFFIRDEATKKEVMMWGDVEPDSLSLSPRNHPAWDEAAIRFHRGLLDTIFIECSYDCCQPDRALFGHLSPRHLLDELQTIATRVVELRTQEEKERREKLKRKRMSLDNIAKNHSVQFLEGGDKYDQDQDDIGHQNGNGNGNGRRGSKSSRHNGPHVHGGGRRSTDADLGHLSPKSQLSPRASFASHHDHDSIDLAVGQRTPEPRTSVDQNPLPSPASISTGLLQHGPLKGLHLVITHVKDTLEDEVDVADNILASLERLEKDRKLGCTFSLSEQGRTFYF